MATMYLRIERVKSFPLTIQFYQISFSERAQSFWLDFVSFFGTLCTFKFTHVTSNVSGDVTLPSLFDLRILDNQPSTTGE